MPACLFTGLPACLPLCLPARRHTGIGMVTKPKSWCHPSDRKSSSKVWQRTPQAATTTPNAATQRQMDTTFEKVPFLCRRNGRHACLLPGRPPCKPACQSACPCACRHTGIQAKVWWKCKEADDISNGRNVRKSGGKGGERTPQAATTTPNAATQRQRDTTLAKVIFLCRRNGWHACLPLCLPAYRHGWEQAYREGCRTALPVCRAGGHRPDQETDV